MKYRLFGITDVGQVRDHNEDDFVICKDLESQQWNFTNGELLELSTKGTLLVVADGMGGTNAGEIASNLAQQSVKEDFQELVTVPEADEEIIDLLKKSILSAHKKIVKHQHSNLDTAGMGTTLVIAWVLNNKLYVAWSGDSRCYLFNNREALSPLTDDHSHVWEMVKQGHLTPEQARVHPDGNLITQNLGDPKQAPKPDAKVTELQTGDRILVCSDGLNGMLSDAQMHYLLVQHKGTAEACKHLVEEANREGGTDNITCLLLDVDPDEAPSTEVKSKRETVNFNNLQTVKSEVSNRTPWIILIAMFVLIFAGWMIWPNQSKPNIDNLDPNNDSKNLVDSLNTKTNNDSTMMDTLESTPIPTSEDSTNNDIVIDSLNNTSNN